MFTLENIDVERYQSKFSNDLILDKFGGEDDQSVRNTRRGRGEET